MDLEIMNKAMISKWLVRFNDPHVHGLWKQVIQSKYKKLRGKNNLSHFWSGVLVTENLINISLDHNIGNGLNIKFWHDRWFGNTSLAHSYPSLYDNVIAKHVTVKEALVDLNLHFEFISPPSGVVLHQLTKLHNSLLNITLDDNIDSISWRWSQDNKFSVKSLYSWIEFGGIIDHTFDSIWNSSIPLKIKIFLWLLRNRNFLTRDVLVKRGIITIDTCVFCDKQETTDHLFVGCEVIHSIWEWIAQYNNFNCCSINKIDDLWSYLPAGIPLKDNNILELVRGAVCWTIWLERNRLCFNDCKVNSLQNLGMQIIKLATFWCKHSRKNKLLNLTLVLPQEVQSLKRMQVLPSLGDSSNSSL